MCVVSMRASRYVRAVSVYVPVCTYVRVHVCSECVHAFMYVPTSESERM